MSQDHLHHYLPLQTTEVVAYALGPVHCKRFELATEYFLERLAVLRLFVHAHHRQSDPALRTFALLRISTSSRHLSVTLICESRH